MSPLQMLALALAVLTFVFLAGYMIGRRVGHQQGSRRAKAKAPIMMRAEAHELGRCPICDTMWDEGVSG